MKKTNTTYKAIIGLIAVISVLQLGLLGEGLWDRIVYSEDSNSTVSPIAPTPTIVEVPAFAPERMEIKSLNLDLPVYAMPLLSGNQNIAPQAVNYTEGTDLVTNVGGNVGFYIDSRYIDFTKESPMIEGKDVVIYGKTQKATYKIVSSTNAIPSDDTIFKTTSNSTLTIVTYDGSYNNKKYLLKAELVTIESIK